MGLPSVTIDSDRHVIEPNHLWRRYLPPSLRERGPRQQAGELTLDGRPVFGHISRLARELVGQQAHARLAHLEAASEPRGQLRAMDAQGVDIAYLFPTFALYLAYVDDADPRLCSAVAQAYNAWLFDYCAQDPRRLKGVGLISRHDPSLMMAELEKVLDRGWRTVVIRPNPIGGRSLGDPAYQPFWAACEASSVAVAIHEGTQARVTTAGAERFHTRFAQHACSHPFEQMMAFLALLESGVFQRHPRLRVAFLEAGASWLPYWLWRLDELSWPHMRMEVAGAVVHPPSTYFRRQCWISFDAGEPGLDLVVRAVGADRLLYGSDYPHPDHDLGHLSEVIAKRAACSVATLQAALSTNPPCFFQGEQRSDQQKLNG